jgi:hypothetical protein
MYSARQWFARAAGQFLRRLVWVKSEQLLYLLFDNQPQEGIQNPFQNSERFMRAGLKGLSGVKHWGMTWRVRRVQGLSFEGRHTVVALEIKQANFACHLPDMAIGDDLDLVEYKY